MLVVRRTKLRDSTKCYHIGRDGGRDVAAFVAFGYSDTAPRTHSGCGMKHAGGGRDPGDRGQEPAPTPVANRGGQDRGGQDRYATGRPGKVGHEPGACAAGPG